MAIVSVGIDLAKNGVAVYAMERYGKCGNSQATDALICKDLTHTTVAWNQQA